MMEITRVSTARGLTAVGTVAFLCVLAYYLGQPGNTWTRLALFVVLVGLAVSGAVGVFYNRELIVAAGACGLILLGVSLAATLWMYLFPVAAILVISALLIANPEQRTTPVTG